MLTREEKRKVIDRLVDKLKQASVFYILDFSGMDTPSMNILRKQLKEKGFHFQVVKNTLLRIALETAYDGGAEPLKKFLVGPSSIIIGEQPAIPARIIKDFRKETGLEKPVLKVAWVEGEIYEGDESLERLASLKSKEELLSETLMLLQAPLNGVLNALRTQLPAVVYSLKHYLEQKEGKQG